MVQGLWGGSGDYDANILWESLALPQAGDKRLGKQDVDRDKRPIAKQQQLHRERLELARQHVKAFVARCSWKELLTFRQAQAVATTVMASWMLGREPKGPDGQRGQVKPAWLSSSLVWKAARSSKTVQGLTGSGIALSAYVSALTAARPANDSKGTSFQWWESISQLSAEMQVSRTHLVKVFQKLRELHLLIDVGQEGYGGTKHARWFVALPIDLFEGSVQSIAPEPEQVPSPEPTPAPDGPAPIDVPGMQPTAGSQVDLSTPGPAHRSAQKVSDVVAPPRVARPSTAPTDALERFRQLWVDQWKPTHGPIPLEVSNPKSFLRSKHATQVRTFLETRESVDVDKVVRFAFREWGNLMDANQWITDPPSGPSIPLFLRLESDILGRVQDEENGKTRPWKRKTSGYDRKRAGEYDHERDKDDKDGW